MLVARRIAWAAPDLGMVHPSLGEFSTRM